MADGIIHDEYKALHELADAVSYLAVALESLSVMLGDYGIMRLQDAGQCLSKARVSISKLLEKAEKAEKDGTNQNV